MPAPYCQAGRRISARYERILLRVRLPRIAILVMAASFILNLEAGAAEEQDAQAVAYFSAPSAAKRSLNRPGTHSRCKVRRHNLLAAEMSMGYKSRILRPMQPLTELRTRPRSLPELHPEQTPSRRLAMFQSGARMWRARYIARKWKCWRIRE